MAAMEASIEQKSLDDLILQPLKRTFDLFAANRLRALPVDEASQRVKIQAKIFSEYGAVLDSEKASARKPAAAAAVVAEETAAAVPDEGKAPSTKARADVEAVIESLVEKAKPKGITSTSIVQYNKVAALTEQAKEKSSAIVARRRPAKVPTPNWHAPWKLMRVISGHNGWVRSVAVEPGNEWFCTGSADRTIKIWDLASGTLKLTLTGHISAIRGLAVSKRHPYMFSAAEDKMVKCWDLETNKVIRHYHGHLSGVYCLALHPTLDVLITGGRDSVARVWDIRTKSEIHVLAGHKNAVASILTQGVDPQIITGSMDNTVRTWDLAAGKTMSVLTNHKKSIRCMAMHERQFTFASGGADNIKKWQLPEGRFMHNMSGHNSILNAMALNHEDVLVSGADDGSLAFWDYSTGYCFQRSETVVQPGSLDAEAGIYAMTFDQTGSRLITCEADKTIKIYKEDDTASPDSHPIDMETWTRECRKIKRF